MPLVHGGNVYEVASELGCAPEQILDFSASINPLGPPPDLLGELSAYFSRIQHYPDIRNSALLERLAEHHGLAPDRITVGNGSTELIYLLPRALGIGKAIVVLPTFSEYRKAFELAGTDIRKVVTTAENDFQPTVEQLDAACGQFSPQAVLLTNPGSPAGTLLPPAIREWVARKSRKDGFFCVVDEVFADFCEHESLKGLIDKSSGLVIIRSMTKFYGMPGLRLGYLFATHDVSARVRHLLPPWSVNTLAQIAGGFCFGRPSYRAKTLDVVESERKRLMKGIRAIEMGHVFPGSANYLLFRLADHLPSASVLSRDLIISDRILVRDCSSFEGLDDRYVRVAVRTPEDNQRLLDGLKRWVGSRVA
jgi:threonine-phosphate decarboxylase